MEYKGATIQKIISIEEIPGCDNIELAKVLGWQCTVKKGEFKPGDLCIYIEIDSVLPIEDEYEFLRKNCYKKFADGTEGFRIRTVRMKGKLSQGLIAKAKCEGCTVPGTDVSDILKVWHYEKPIPANMAGEVIGNFPAFIRKTDEVRIQTDPGLLESLHGKPYYITTKLDGTSATYYYKEDHFGVCSRNMELKESDNNLYWKIAKQYHIKEILERVKRISDEELCIQGEIVGSGIQKNPLGLSDQQFFVFNVYSITNQVYYQLNDIIRIMTLLQLPVVVVEEAGSYFNSAIDELLEKATGKYKGTEHNKEGIVVRATNQSVSFKVVNNEYLLKEDD